MGNLFEELKRRNVVRVGAAYMVAGWIIMQVIDVIVPTLELPDWFARVVLVLLLIGFPVALLLAWAFELTPAGVKRTEEVDGDASVTAATGRKLDRMIIAGLIAAVAFLLYDRGLSTVEDEPEPAAVAEVAPADRRVTIAVLPFTDLSAARDQEYFGDGIAEEIINRLVSIEALKVTSRTSAFAFKGSNKSIPDIAAALGTGFVVEGSVRSAGDRLRITAQLIEVASDSHLWSEVYNRRMDDIFAIQDDISSSIADALELRLVGTATKKRPTRNLEAYRLYLQGHHLFLRRGARNLEKAIERFEEAVALDPEFAEAWADLAVSTILLPSYDNSRDRATAVARGGEAADRALALDPLLAQGWVAKGISLLRDFKWAEARAALERAVELNPNNDTAWLWLGVNHMYGGLHADAQAAAERAVKIAPVSGANIGVLGRIQLMRGRLGEARKANDEAVALGYASAHGELAVLAAIAGDNDRVVEQLRMHISRFGEQADDKLIVYVQAFADPSRRQAARLLLKADVERGRHLQSMWGSLLLGDGESYVYVLENLSMTPNWYISSLWHVPFRPMLGQQVVKDYLVRVGLVDFWRQVGWPDFCRPLGADDFECN